MPAEIRAASSAQNYGMPNYRRAWVPGGTYFFTVNLLEGGPFEVLAVVVLPDHLHCLWRLPASDADNATRWRLIKSSFSRMLEPGERRSSRRVAKGERGIWQRRYWEHLIRDDRDLSAHVDYIHINPVKHGYVARVRDWPYSSFHRHVRGGDLPLDWGNGVEMTGALGEDFGEGAAG